MNLLRRQLGPVAWAEVFRTYAEIRGVADRIGRPGWPTGESCTVQTARARLAGAVTDEGTR